MELIIIEKSDLTEIVQTAILKAFEQQKKDNEPVKLYTVNQCARKLGKAHSSIKKLVAQGFLKTTKTGLIPESSIEEYLNG